MKRPNFKVGDKVFAKVKGYPPWPARIVSENGKKFNVEFYGTGETGSIKSEDLFYYLKNKEKFQKPLKRKDYIDAFEQINEAIEKDGGDGDEAPNVNDSLAANVSLNATNVNSTPDKPDKKTVAKRKRSLPEEPVAEVSTPKKKSARLNKNSEEAQKSGEPTEETEKGSVPSKKSPKAPKSPKVDKNEKKADSEQQEESKIEGEEEAKEESPKDDEKVIESEKEISEAMNDDIKSRGMPFELVLESSLKNNITYAEHVKKKESFFKDRKVDPREDQANQVLPIKLPEGSIGGIKLHLSWPLKFDNEYDRALYDETVAKRVLEAKIKIEGGDTAGNTDENFVTDIKMTDDEVHEVLSTKDVEMKKARISRLNLEAELLGLDVKIKNCLGLDKADPKEAIEYLEEMCNLEFDDIVLKKHLHIVEMVRRLRKYVGNTREWKMNDESLNEFTKQAEKVREMAEKVYGKFKKAVELPENCSSFFEGFTELVNQFRAECKELEMTETDIFVLCAEPRSRQAFLNRLDEKETEKEKSNGPANSEQETTLNGTNETAVETN